MDEALLGQELSLWIGFFFSLMIASLLTGENFFSRLAQYILVGVGMGYLGTLTVQHVLRPRLFSPLLNEPTNVSLWLVLLLGGLLCVAGIERIVAQSPGETATNAKRSAPQQVLRILGVIPVALLLGIGTTVLIIGILQGTFWPQFWQAARTGLNVLPTLGGTLTGLLLLLLTTATLLHWSVPVEAITVGQAAWVRYLLRWWGGLGKRALWFAGGLLFARLFASHLSLLIARVQFFIHGLGQSALWLWAEEIGKGLLGG